MQHLQSATGANSRTVLVALWASELAMEPHDSNHIPGPPRSGGEHVRGAPVHVPSHEWVDPGGPPAPPKSSREMVPWLLGLVAIVAIVAFVAMVILNQSTRSDSDESKETVSDLAGDLARARGDIERLGDQVDETEDELAEESRNVRDVQDQLSELDSVASD